MPRAAIFLLLFIFFRANIVFLVANTSNASASSASASSASVSHANTSNASVSNASLSGSTSLADFSVKGLSTAGSSALNLSTAASLALAIQTATPAANYIISDDAGLLTENTRAIIIDSAYRMQLDFGVHFLLQTVEKMEIKNFERESKDHFTHWIQNVPAARGILIYMQIEKNSMKGRINMSFGYGLKGLIEQERVQQVLNDKLLPFCHDLSDQKSLIDGVNAFFSEIQKRYQNGLSSGTLPANLNDGMAYVFWRKIAFAMIPICSLILTVLVFVYRKKKCPECGARVHVSIRPTVRGGEGRYSRIKIVKCLECSYYKKYLY